VKPYSQISFFNQIVDAYKGILELYNFAKPGVTIKLPYFVISNIALAQANINSVAYSILCINEEIEKYSKNHSIQHINDVIDEHINKITPQKLVIKDSSLDSDGVRKQIRNCLAHAHFSVVELYDDENDHTFKNINVVLENKSIKYYLSYSDFLKLITVFYDIQREIEDKSDEIVIANFNSKTKNLVSVKEEIDDYLMLSLKTSDKVSFLSSKSYIPLIKNELIKKGIKEYDINSLLNYVTNSIEDLESVGLHIVGFTLEPLSEEKKKLIFSYIKSIGIGNWVNLPLKEKKSMLSYIDDFIIFDKKNIPSPNDMNLLFGYTALCGSKNGNVPPKVKNELIDFFKFERFIAPFQYAERLLELSYFVFNCARETFNSYNSTKFNYNFYNIDGVKSIITSDDDYYKLVYPRDLIQNKLDQAKKERNAKIKNIKKAKQLVTTLEDPRNCHPDKVNLLKVTKEKILENYQALKHCNEEIVTLTEGLNNCLDNTPYYDCSNFFRHLRNSLSHPDFHKVIYDDAFDKNDLSKIKFRFEDYSHDTSTRHDSFDIQ